MKSIIFILFYLSYFPCFSQIQNTTSDNLTIFENLESVVHGQGIVTIEQPFGVKNILEKQIQFNSKFIGSKGYRIQIGFFSGNKGREKAYKTKTNAVSELPEYDIYIVFSQPYFKVRIGDFYTKSQALMALKKIKEIYPGAFIVDDLIHIK